MTPLWLSTRKGPYPLAVITVVLSALLGLTYLTESIIVSVNEDSFQNAIDKRCVEYLQAAQKEFVAVQEDTRSAAVKAANHPGVLRFLTGADTSEASLFDVVVSMARDMDVGLEVYDRHGSLAAWEGRSGVSHASEVRAALEGAVTSYVNRNAITSQLFVFVPVRGHDTIVGAVLVRQTVDMNYPLNNQYIQHEGLTKVLSRRLGVNVEFDFSPGAGLRKDGRYASALLFGIDSAKVGSVSILRPPRAAYFDSIVAPYHVIESLLLLAILGVVAATLWRMLAKKTLRPAIRLMGGIALIWGVRYALLWIDISSVLPSLTLFDPSLFASQFGFGIARSSGELTISVLALVCTGLLCITVIEEQRSLGGGPLRLFLRSSVLRVLASLAAIVVLFWLFYGFAAVVHSVVYDSTIRFADQQEIFPSMELAVITIDMMTTASCLMVVGIGTVWFVLQCLSAGPVVRIQGWIGAAALLSVVACLFGFVLETPVIPIVIRVAFGVFVMLALVLVSRRPGEVQWKIDGPTSMFILVAAVALYYPLLDKYVQEKDRDRVESFAEQVSRPADSWLTFVVNEGLHDFSSDETVEALLSDDEQEVARIAFVRWAQSLACKEGYASMFSVSDTAGKVLSRFFIGGQIQNAMRADTNGLVADGPRVDVLHVGAGLTALDVYSGTTPILTYDGRIIGYGKVLVAAGRQTLFRGENPRLLRSAEAEDLESFYRPISISEFRGGVLYTTTNLSLPIHYRIPAAAERELANPSATSAWVEEQINSRTYETYYFRRAGSTAIVALGLAKPGPRWYVVGLVKILSFTTLLFLVVIAVILLLRLSRHKPVLPSFRERLLAALLVTAVVPLILIALYGKFLAREGVLANLSSRLSDYTLSVTQNVPEQADSLLHIGAAVPFAMTDEIATDVGTDFNIFVNNTLALTSRPELFEAGIIDRRISGRAYDNVVLRGRRFYMETERIGEYEYAVGYRPILDSEGSIASIVSVPTLFRQDELDAEVSGRNVFVIGIYLVVFVAILFIAGIFANRIAAPIHRLTEATRRVAGGNLDVDLGNVAADGEIGELVRSFESMTGDLKRSRQELIHAERELAWREMARQVAHEIKNPLTPMKLAVQHLRMVFREGGTDFKQVLEEVTQTLLNQIDTLSRIASEFSHFARMPHPDLIPCNASEILREAVQLFDREGRVHFLVHLDESLPLVMADKDELRRAFVNILRNAVQAIGDRGTVEVSTHVVGHELELAIRDDGPGIPPELQNRLFQPYFSTKTEGMGLGLAIVKKTIDDLGGTIRIESNPGAGTVVTIRLPLKATISDPEA